MSLRTSEAEVDVMDPFASPLEVLQEYGIRLVERPGKKYDAVVVAVAHTTYLKLDESYFMSITNETCRVGGRERSLSR